MGSMLSSRFAFAFFISLISGTVATNFLDPINWPKQIALITLVPMLFYVAFRDLSPSVFLKSLLNKKIFWFFPSAILLILIAILSPANATRTLWGLWGRSNGVLAYLCFIFIAVSAFVFNTRFEAIWSSLRVLSIFAFLTSIYGLSQFFSLDPISWSSKDQVFGFFGNTNFASAIWGIGALSTIGLLLYGPKNNDRRWHHWLFLVVTSTASLLTNSIQGPVAIAIGLVIFLFPKILGMRNFARVASSTLILLVSTISISGLVGVGPLGNIFNQYTLKLRSFYWLTGLEMGKSNFLIGVGVDSYGDYYRMYRTTTMAETTSIDLIANNAHNSLIQVFATMGVLGLFAVGVPIFAGIYFALRAFLRLRKSFQIEQYVVATLYVVLVLVSQISIDNIAVAVWMWFSLGLLLSQSSIVTRRSAVVQLNARGISIGKPLAYLLSCACFAISWASAYPDREILKIFNTPVYAQDTQSIDSREEKLLAVVRRSNLQEGQFALVVQGLSAVERYGTSILVLNASLKTYPNDYRLINELARLQENFGDSTSALKYRKQQIKLDPRNPRAFFSAAQILKNLGKTAEAKIYANSAFEYRQFLSPSEQESLRVLLGELKS